MVSRIGSAIVAAAALTLAACSTTPVSNEQAKWVPQSSILDRSYMNRAPGTGEVTIKRDSGAMGSVCAIRMFVNGKPLADLSTGEKVVVHLPPGDHILSAQPRGVCGGIMAETRASVRADDKLSFRFGYSGSGTPSLHQTAF